MNQTPMRHATANPKQRAAGPRSRKSLCFACFTILLAGSVAAAQADPHPAQSKRARAGRPAVALPAPTVAPKPQAPEPPKWPANEDPKQPTVVWNSQGLRIQASNSNLSQILNQISTETGAKIEGLSKDERVYGEYGPGEAKDVLAQLLRGSGYDYLMLGDEGQGTPRTVVLSARKNTPPAANQNPAMNSTPDQQDDETVPDSDSDDPDQPPQVYQPVQPVQPPQQDNPQGQITPQQRMQLMQQQRLQQMQEMQRQYQQQQQQQPEQPQ